MISDLPHQGISRLIDKVVNIDDKSVTVELEVRKALFNNPANIPAIVAVEYIAQASGVLIGSIQKSSKSGMVVAVKSYREYVDSFKIGESLTVCSTITNYNDSIAMFSGKVFKQDQLQVELNISLVFSDE